MLKNILSIMSSFYIIDFCFVVVNHLPLNVAIEAFDAHGLRGQNDRTLGKY